MTVDFFHRRVGHAERRGHAHLLLDAGAVGADPAALAVDELPKPVGVEFLLESLQLTERVDSGRSGRRAGVQELLLGKDDLRRGFPGVHGEKAPERLGRAEKHESPFAGPEGLRGVHQLARQRRRDSGQAGGVHRVVRLVEEDFRAEIVDEALGALAGHPDDHEVAGAPARDLVLIVADDRFFGGGGICGFHRDRARQAWDRGRSHAFIRRVMMLWGAPRLGAAAAGLKKKDVPSHRQNWLKAS